MVRKDIAILLSALGVLVVTYNLWPRLWPGAFYHGMAVGFLLLLLVIHSMSKKGDTIRYVAEVGVWLCVNNLLDEAFFDPKKFAINEYITAVIITVITYRKWRIIRMKRHR